MALTENQWLIAGGLVVVLLIPLWLMRYEIEPVHGIRVARLDRWTGKIEFCAQYGCDTVKETAEKKRRSLDEIARGVQ